MRGTKKVLQLTLLGWLMSGCGGDPPGQSGATAAEVQGEANADPDQMVRIPPEIVFKKINQGKKPCNQAERWMLDKKKKQYKRSNNINQPGSFHLFMPANRTLLIKIKYNGKKYSFIKSVM